MPSKENCRRKAGFIIVLSSLALTVIPVEAQFLKVDKRDNRAKVELKSDWLPTSAEVSRVEALLKMPRKVGKLENYDRYWIGKIEKGRKQIYGYLTSNEFEPVTRRSAGRAIITKYAMVDPIWDAGCWVVFVTYDVQTDRILKHTCSSGLSGPDGPAGWRYKG